MTEVNKWRRLRLAWHAARKAEMRNLYIILVGRPKRAVSSQPQFIVAHCINLNFKGSVVAYFKVWRNRTSERGSNPVPPECGPRRNTTIINKPYNCVWNCSTWRRREPSRICLLQKGKTTQFSVNPHDISFRGPPLHSQRNIVDFWRHSGITCHSDVCGGFLTGLPKQ